MTYSRRGILAAARGILAAPAILRRSARGRGPDDHAAAASFPARRLERPRAAAGPIGEARRGRHRRAAAHPGVPVDAIRRHAGAALRPGARWRRRHGLHAARLRARTFSSDGSLRTAVHRPSPQRRDIAGHVGFRAGAHGRANRRREAAVLLVPRRRRHPRDAQGDLARRPQGHAPALSHAPGRRGAEGRRGRADRHAGDAGGRKHHPASSSTAPSCRGRSRRPSSCRISRATVSNPGIRRSIRPRSSSR